MDYGIDATRVTATTALIYTHSEDAGLVMPFTIYASDGTTVVESVSGDDPRWGVIEASSIEITGLTPATTYVAKNTNEPSISTTFTTLVDSPKVATESMWADLISRIKTLDTASSYSTTEIATGRTWVDGSPIYKKSVYLNQFPNATSKDFPHGITGLDTVISASGFAKSSADAVQRPIPYVGRSTFNECILLDISTTDVIISCGTDRSALSGYVTLYYTKSA